MDRQTIMRIASGAVGLGLVALGAWLAVQGEDEHSGLLILAGIGVSGGGLGTALLPSALGSGSPTQRPPRARRGTRTPPLPVLLALALVSGCGASGLRTQAHAALVAGTVTHAAWQQVDHARTVRLDQVESSVSQSPDRDLIIAREAERWTPIGAAFDAVRDALLAWVQAIELARIAGEDALTLEDWIRFVPLAGRVALLYDDVARLATELGTEVPALPPAVRALASAPEGR